MVKSISDSNKLDFSKLSNVLSITFIAFLSNLFTHGIVIKYLRFLSIFFFVIK